MHVSTPHLSFTYIKERIFHNSTDMEGDTPRSHIERKDNACWRLHERGDSTSFFFPSLINQLTNSETKKIKGSDLFEILPPYK
jgi:hypothetical protein